MKNISDKILLITVLILTTVGLVLIFSASSSFGLIKKNDFTYFFYHQIKAIIAAAVAFTAGVFIPYKFYKKFSLYMMFAVVLMLIVVLFSDEKKGAARWFEIFGYSIQPVELAKVILVFHLSRLIVRLDEKIKSLKKLLIPLGWIGVISILTAAEPNFSNALIIGMSGIILLYIGGARKRQLVSISVISIILVFTVMWFTPHSHARLEGWLGMATDSKVEAPSLQVNEALIGIGSGGITGVGIGKSQQSNLFLPEAYSDFIFAILGEELGFVGSVAISSLYILFFLMALVTMQQIEDRYGSLLVFGLSFNIVFSAMINIGVVLGFLPTTGITLPFISYGGSSLLGFVFSVGVILNVNTEGELFYKSVNALRRFFNWINKTDNAKV